MSCEHGNWAPCELCEALDKRWNAGYAASTEKIEKLKLLLRECDAAICMLGGSGIASELRKEIAKIIGDIP